MCGRGPFALPTFQALYGTRHQVAGLVTRPVPLGPGRRPQHQPLRDEAERHATPVLDPADINAEASRAALAAWRPDLLVVCDYGQILSPATLELAPLRGINLHGSLLPKYQGAAPVNWALYHGETETGVTVIHMTPRVDAGPCLAQASTPIGPDETAPELEARLALLGAPLVCRVIDELAEGRAKPVAQDAARATRAPKLRKSHGQVDWSRSAQQIKNQVRALEPWPATFTCWQRPGGQPLRLILRRVSVSDAPGAQAQPGEVLCAEKGSLRVATGSGALQIELVQPEGKRVLTAAELLRGYPVKPGQRFGPAAQG
jgi:methionyl-tRNA formyltransferase